MNRPMPRPMVGAETFAPSHRRLTRPRRRFAPVAAEDARYLVGNVGIGDALHVRAALRQLVAMHGDVWLRTPWPSLYHDLPGVHCVLQATMARTASKNIVREAALFESEPRGASWRWVGYDEPALRSHPSVLAAVCASVSVPPGDFRMPVPKKWKHGLRLPKSRPVLVLRPLILRDEYRPGVLRNPDRKAYETVYRHLRDRFFVVSVADIDGAREKLVQDDPGADITLHAGELDIRQMCALWRDADLVMTSSGFGVIMAQAVGTASLVVYGGYESARSFSGGAGYAPMLNIEPVRPCNCYDHTHQCEKTIDIDAALGRVDEFLEELLCQSSC